MRFLPKSRASMDHAPGPTIAKMAPRTACMMGTHGPPESESCADKATHTLTTATSPPATGVHRPIRRSMPAPAPMSCRTMIVSGVPARKLTIAEKTIAEQVSTRKSSRPTPGQPFANVEKRRCKGQRKEFVRKLERLKLGTVYTTFGGSPARRSRIAKVRRFRV
jgi:hypothetical protein